MKITELWNQKEITLSFEVFPPKRDADVLPIKQEIQDIAKLKPDFMSVTYGAGGTTSENTVAMSSMVEGMGVTALAHLTCMSSSRQEIQSHLAQLKQQGIENILALRGDPPADPALQVTGEYHFAKELITQIKADGNFCVGAACYPEGHVECDSKEQDLYHLREKAESGCDFLITQMFFDNSVLYSFLYRMLDNHINLPVIAGVMPVTNAKQIKRICQLSGTSLPSRFRMIIDKFGHDPLAMKQAGIAYATEQIIDLIANGVKGIHVYTMNKPEVAASITANLSDILKR